MKIKISLLIFCIILLSSSVLSLEASIKINPIMSEGDKIEFNYTIISEYSENIKLYPSIICTKSPSSNFIEDKNIDLVANVPYKGSFFGGSIIDETFESEYCYARLEVEDGEIIANELFSIDVKPSIDLFLMTCKDKECNIQTGLFIKGETIYFDYSSSIEDLDIVFNLIYSNGSKIEYNPPFNINTLDTGVYQIDFKATKEGYRDFSMIQYLDIIEREYSVIKNSEESKASLRTMIIGLLIIFGIIAILLYFLKREIFI